MHLNHTHGTLVQPARLGSQFQKILKNGKLPSLLAEPLTLWMLIKVWTKHAKERYAPSPMKAGMEYLPQETCWSLPTKLLLKKLKIIPSSFPSLSMDKKLVPKNKQTNNFSFYFDPYFALLVNHLRNAFDVKKTLSR